MRKDFSGIKQSLSARIFLIYFHLFRFQTKEIRERHLVALLKFTKSRDLESSGWQQSQVMKQSTATSLVMKRNIVALALIFLLMIEIFLLSTYFLFWKLKGCRSRKQYRGYSGTVLCSIWLTKNLVKYYPKMNIIAHETDLPAQAKPISWPWSKISVKK